LPYLLGIIIGFLYENDYLTPSVKNKEAYGGKKVIDYLTDRRYKRVLISLLGIIILIMIDLGYRIHPMPRFLDFAYVIYARTLFCIGILLIILPVLVGKGRILRLLLANPIMVVIGRLSYCIYLIHLMLITYSIMNT